MVTGRPSIWQYIVPPAVSGPSAVSAGGISAGRPISPFRPIMPVPREGRILVYSGIPTASGRSGELPGFTSAERVIKPSPVHIGAVISRRWEYFGVLLDFWVIRGVTRAYFGGANDIPVSGRVPDFLSDRPLVDSSDYNGDGTDDIAVFRPSTGLWAIRGVSRLYFGQSDDIPAPGDYSGAGTTMVSVYRSNGHLWNVRNLTQVNFGSRLIQQPVPADYTGDGISDMGFYYDGLWTIRIQFPIPYVFEVQFGQAGDQPVPGNYGGGKSELLAVFRPSTGLWAVKSLTSIYFGIDGDIGMPADYNGDGVSDPAVYRPTRGSGIVRNITAVNFKDYDGTLPLVGDFDGNGTYGMGLFRPADGLWQINDLTRFYFGGCADIPVSGSPDAYSF